MPSTYIDLSNKTLRRLNEVEIPVSDFPNVRGVQALVKDAVKAAIAKINQAEFEWPFNAAEFTQTLVAGQSEYSWPTAFKKADWNTFQIIKNESLNTGFSTLKYMDRDEWYATRRDADYEAGNAGVGVPEYVFASGPDIAETVALIVESPLFNNLSAFVNGIKLPYPSTLFR